MEAAKLRSVVCGLVTRKPPVTFGRLIVLEELGGTFIIAGAVLQQRLTVNILGGEIYRGIRVFAKKRQKVGPFFHFMDGCYMHILFCLLLLLFLQKEGRKIPEGDRKEPNARTGFPKDQGGKTGFQGGALARKALLSSERSGGRDTARGWRG